MQIVSLGDILHAVTNPISGESRKIIINLSITELAHSVLSVEISSW